MFIVFEGIDGCGKDTQLSLLKEHYEEQGKTVRVYNNIDQGILSYHIRDMLVSKQISSYDLSFIVLANIVNTYNKILADINNGYIVLCSRWILSSIVYGGYRDINNLNKLCEIGTIMSMDMKPDCIIYLDVEPDVAMERIVARNSISERYDSISKLTLIRDSYKTILNREHTLSHSTIHVNGSDTISSIKNYIVDNIQYV